MPETNEKSYAIFKKTREERGLSLSDVANALHLTVTMIEQIEAGDVVHRHLAPVFMRGYIRSYAKYLSLPDNIVNEIVKTLEAPIPMQVTTEKAKPIYKKQPPKLSIKKILSYFAVVAILIIAASFWHSGNQPAPQQAENSVQPSENTPPPSNNEDAAQQPEEDAALLPEEETTVTTPEEAAPPPPEATITPPTEQPPLVSAPAPVKKKITPPVFTPTQPEVVDAQETP